MKHIILIISTILLLSSCQTKNTEVSQENHQSNPEKVNDTLPEMAVWADDFIIDYLEHNSERLTEVDGHPVTYMKDAAIREGRKYAMVKIGHSFEHRYVTDQWIFIDSLTKEIYEYDLPNDSLILWTGNENQINPTGTYILETDTITKDGERFGYTGRIQVKLLKSNKIAMSFGVMKGAPSYNSGSFVDTLSYITNKAIYTVPSDIDPSCKITFTFSEKDVKIVEETDDYNSGCGFGHAVVADGVFNKKSSDIPELRHYITDEKIE
jgi:hypothetical protein